MLTRLTEQQEKIYNKVLTSIISLPVNEEKNLDVKSTGYENFIQCCKHMIDCADDWNNGFSLVFNSSYTKFRKDARINFAIKK